MALTDIIIPIVIIGGLYMAYASGALCKLAPSVPQLCSAGGAGGNFDPIQSLQEAAGIRSAPGEGMNLAQQIEKITPSKPGGGIGLDLSPGGGSSSGFDRLRQQFQPVSATNPLGTSISKYAGDDGGISRIRFSNGATITNYG